MYITRDAMKVGLVRITNMSSKLRRVFHESVYIENG